MALVSFFESDCPSCGAEQKFGIIDIRHPYILKGCATCRYKERERLPLLRKKIVYLDQFFLSHVFRGNDERFLIAADKLTKLAQYQLIVTPYSTLHEDETDLWEWRDELLDFIKNTSRGHEFVAEYELENTQILKAFSSWLEDSDSGYLLEESDVFNEDIHEWEGYFRINIDRFRTDREKARSLKSESVSSLVDLFDLWRESQSTFEEAVAIELADAAKGYLEAYFSYASRMSQGDFTALLNAPVASIVVQSLLQSVPAEVPTDQRLQTILRFFSSEHFRSIPNEVISAKIFGLLRKMVKMGAYTNRKKAITRLSGFFYDVRHVSKYAPYCDAFFADRAMAELLEAPELDLQKNYGVRIFTIDSIDKFHEWLDEIEKGMSSEHRAALKRAYPYLAV
ncbi:hypothetical protein TH8_10920 [Thalassospira profundimaris]|uniref:Uncharacterized protein n=1 Tax=Thalassospira povalilytica TaxID=732237 RepID=A0ABX4R7P1_9PROT|nr:hypothetical protein [Thalassospira povalilytica]PKR49382.1 hypothetical protein CU041_13095 [Thalassospira povalilytica]RCK26197.1 hypothetical protein TH8_10920 [Thalassospira profundimaris]